MKKWIRENRLPLFFAMIGLPAGWLYYYYVGCVNGTCPIQSDPYKMMLYGTVMGFLIGSILKPEKKKN